MRGFSGSTEFTGGRPAWHCLVAALCLALLPSAAAQADPEQPSAAADVNVDVKGGFFDKSTIGKDMSVISSPSRIKRVKPAVAPRTAETDSFAIAAPENNSPQAESGGGEPEDIEGAAGEDDRLVQMRRSIQAAAGDNTLQSIVDTTRELSEKIHGVPPSAGENGIPDVRYFEQVIRKVEQHTDNTPERRRRAQAESNRF